MAAALKGSSREEGDEGQRTSYKREEREREKMEQKGGRWFKKDRGRQAGREGGTEMPSSVIRACYLAYFQSERFMIQLTSSLGDEEPKKLPKLKPPKPPKPPESTRIHPEDATSE